MDTHASVQHPDVFDQNVLHVGHNSLVLTKRSHGLAVRTVAVHVVDMYVRAVALGREAIITDVNPYALD